MAIILRRGGGRRSWRQRSWQGLSGACADASQLRKPWAKRSARLALENGSVFHGVPFGANGTTTAELVFNTTLTGYQEVMTDPSYAGQAVLFTQPHIGNTGVNSIDEESTTCHLNAIVCRQLSPIVSSYRSSKSLSDYLAERNVVGIEGVDTRAITRRIRESGCLVACISTDLNLSHDEIVNKAASWSILGKDLVSTVTCPEPYEWTEDTGHQWEFKQLLRVGENGNASAGDGGAASAEAPLRVVAFDFGVKANILRRLRSYGCEINVVPADFPAEEVMKMEPDGVLFSNGPGDPSAVPYAVDSAKQIIGTLPSFGICMGHQVIGQALGASTFKLKFGHHGGNHPVRHMKSGRVEISSQNHNYAVDPDALPESVEVTHINLNDGTCAGMRYEEKQMMAIQYHPEASPGPHDADVSFEDFVRMMRDNRRRQSRQGIEASPA